MHTLDTTAESSIVTIQILIVYYREVVLFSEVLLEP